MDIVNAVKVENYLQNMCTTLSSILDNDSIQAVTHYNTHAEYEMAFEGLFIELMNLKEPPAIDVKESVEIAYLLNLDNESVFLSNFWERFQVFIAKCKAAG